MSQSPLELDAELAREKLSFEKEKWREEVRLRRREIAMQRINARRSRWANPLVIAVFTAAAAGMVNVAVSFMNGRQQDSLERLKAEQSLVLESIRTNGNIDKAAVNLSFLVDVGLITQNSDSIKRFLSTKTTGEGPAIFGGATFAVDSNDSRIRNALSNDATLRTKLNTWLGDNAPPGTSIPLFLNGLEYAALRQRAIADLQIP